MRQLTPRAVWFRVPRRHDTAFCSKGSVLSRFSCSDSRSLKLWKTFSSVWLTLTHVTAFCGQAPSQPVDRGRHRRWGSLPQPYVLMIPQVKKLVNPSEQIFLKNIAQNLPFGSGNFCAKFLKIFLDKPARGVVQFFDAWPAGTRRHAFLCRIMHNYALRVCIKMHLGCIKFRVHFYAKRRIIMQGKAKK